MYKRLNEIATDLVDWMIENADLRYIDIPCSCPEGTKTITINNPYYVKPKRKIYLYRYLHYNYDKGWTESTTWIDVPHEVAFDQNVYRLLNTEEKEIEVDDE